jgi:hypothetical protein
MFNENRNIIILICFKNIIGVITSTIKTKLPIKYFDNKELNEIANVLLTNIYMDIFNISSINGEINDYSEHDTDKTDVYQNSVDYLMYCGLDQDSAFRVTHHAETLVLHAILDVVPDIDNKNKFNIINMNLKETEFKLTVRVKNEQSYNFNTININRV